jgi:hypothetical protein
MGSKQRGPCFEKSHRKKATEAIALNPMDGGSSGATDLSPQDSAVRKLPPPSNVCRKCLHGTLTGSRSLEEDRP